MKTSKKLMSMTVICLIAIIARICISNQMDSAKKPYQVSHMKDFLQQGEIVALTDVFPGNWDCVQIINTVHDDYELRKELYEFAEKSSRKNLDIIERYYLIVFKKQNQTIEYIQYSPLTDGFVFTENGELKDHWMLTLSKEQAVFKCTLFEEKPSYFSDELYYALEVNQ